MTTDNNHLGSFIIHSKSHSIQRLFYDYLSIPYYGYGLNQKIVTGWVHRGMVMDLVDLHHSPICHQGSPTFALEILGAPPPGAVALLGVYGELVPVQDYLWVFCARTNPYQT